MNPSDKIHSRTNTDGCDVFAGNYLYVFVPTPYAAESSTKNVPQMTFDHTEISYLFYVALYKKK